MSAKNLLDGGLKIWQASRTYNSAVIQSVALSET